MPTVCAGLGDNVELAAGRMPVFRAELIREQRELCDRFLNHGLCGTVCIHLVVIHAVMEKPLNRGLSRQSSLPSRVATLLRVVPGANLQTPLRPLLRCLREVVNRFP